MVETQAPAKIEGFRGDVLAPGDEGYERGALDVERDVRQAAGADRALLPAWPT